LVYCCKISNDCAVVAHALALCSPVRRQKAERIKNLKARELSIVSGLLLRYGLLKEGIDEDIAYSENGRPFIKGDKLFFSLSHSGEYAACATSKKPIGIDIQKIIEIKERTMLRFCTEAETEHIKSSDEPNLTAVKLWALKESYLKASGCSTQQAFAAEFDIGGNAVKGPVGYKFEISCEIEGYILAVCSSV